MAHNIKVSDRFRDLAIGVLAVLLALWLAGCDGAGAPGLKQSAAGVTYCDIPSPSGDVVHKGTSSETMREWYYMMADTGYADAWGVLVNLDDFRDLCKKTSSVACEAALTDQVKYCFNAKFAWDESEKRYNFRFEPNMGPMVTEWDGNSTYVTTALCTPEGAFAGWLCVKVY
jgi:hypothetical protein